MSAQVIEFAAPSGLTLTLSVFTEKTDTVLVNAQSCVERINKNGFYTCSFTSNLNGNYDVIIKAGTFVIAVDKVKMIDADGVYQVESLVIPSSTSDLVINANVVPTKCEQITRYKEELIHLMYMENTNVALVFNEDIILDDKILKFVIETTEKVNLLTINDADISRLNNTMNIVIGTNISSDIGTYLWSLRDITDGETVLARGFLEVDYAPR